MNRRVSTSAPVIVDAQSNVAYQVAGDYPLLSEFIASLNEYGERYRIEDGERYRIVNVYTFNPEHPVREGTEYGYMHTRMREFTNNNPRMLFHNLLKKMERGQRRPLAVIYYGGAWQLAIPEVANGTSSVISNLARSIRLSTGQVEEFLREWVEQELGKEVTDKVFAVLQEEEDDEEEEFDEDDEELPAPRTR